jgi:hypothetical protein
MSRLLVGIVLMGVGLVLALIGGAFMTPDMHPVATGLIAVGLVMTGAALIERRLDERVEHQPTREPTRE